jgi:hypothetical protein
VGKVSVCCEGSWICGRGGGGWLALVLTWGLVLFGTGYVICRTAGRYVIWATGGWYVIWGVGGGCGVRIRLAIGRSLGLTVLVGLLWKKRRVGWRVLLMVGEGSPLHGVVDFSWCGLR